MGWLAKRLAYDNPRLKDYKGQATGRALPTPENVGYIVPGGYSWIVDTRNRPIVVSLRA